MTEYATLHNYDVFQLSMRPFSSFINEHGWTKAAKLRKEVHVHLETTCKGSEAWKPDYDRYFHLVATIRAENLDGVFEAGNIGPEYLIKRHAPMHSISKGDLILAPTGRTYMVDGNGFTEVNVHKDAA